MLQLQHLHDVTVVFSSPPSVCACMLIHNQAVSLAGWLPWRESPRAQSLTSSSHTLPEVTLGWNVGVGVPAALSCLHCPRGQGLDLAGPASFIVAPRYICYRLDNGPCSLVCMDACRASLMSSQLRTVT